MEGRSADAAEFGRRLRAVIRERRLTQKEAAGKAGITAESMSAYCRGKRGPDFSVLMALSEALEVSPAVFFCPLRQVMSTASACWMPGGYNADEERNGVRNHADDNRVE